MEFMNPLIEQLDAMWTGFVKLLPSLALAIFVILITWIVARAARKAVAKLASHSQLRPSLRALFETFASILIWIVGILIAVTIVFPSITPAKLLAALGLGSIAVGFAFKDIFENFMAGVMIMWRKPMRIGDVIECEGVEGKVEHISIRDTFIRKLDDELVLVPNGMLYKNPVYIRTDKDQRRFEIVAGVSYDSDLEQARDIIVKAVEGLDGVDSERGVQVFAREFNSSSVDFTVRWWAGSRPIDMHETRDRVIRSIKQALDDAEIEIPFPYRTLTFKEPLTVANDGGDDAAGDGREEAAHA